MWCSGVPDFLPLAHSYVSVERKKKISKNKQQQKQTNKKEGVAAAAVYTKRINQPFTCRLPDDSSIYTAELWAILLALKHVYYSKGKSFSILILFHRYSQY